MDDDNKTTSVRVLYIVGYGRSGSTLLDTILGSHPAVESVGELTNLPRSGWLNGEYCACGVRGHLCPFWTDIRNEWIERTGAALHDYMALQKRFERDRSWPLLLREMRRPSRQFRAYAEQTKALFEIIRRQSGKPVIVDSSKRPARALALSMVNGIDLRLIHLVRDGRGVVWSRRKFLPRNDREGVQRNLYPVPVWRTSLLWRLGNLLAERVVRRVGEKGLRVRYEDLVAEPQETLNRIGEIAGLDFTAVGAEIANGATLRVGHTIAGSRMRMKGQVKLRGDWEWRERLPAFDRKVFWLLAGSLAGKYGYRRD